MSDEHGTCSELQPLRHRRKEIVDPLGTSSVVQICDRRKGDRSELMMIPDDSIPRRLFLIALSSLSGVPLSIDADPCDRGNCISKNAVNINFPADC
ncbi:hypothetical protein TNCV_1661641 [Trichonephila clavipes]|nr:hypothetical protein TNCV_1661641 [Trichonephila clavipes]